MQPYCHGYTLYEMLIVLSILAIVLSMTLPSMNRVILRQNAQLSYVQLKAALKYAQQEAIRRDHAVIICPANYNQNHILSGCLKAANRNCSGWSCGILAYIDFEHSGDYSSSGSGNLRVNATRLDNGVTIRVLGAHQSFSQLIISPAGIIHDQDNNDSWIFIFSQSRFKQRVVLSAALNSYGSFCLDGADEC